MIKTGVMNIEKIKYFSNYEGY